MSNNKFSEKSTLTCCLLNLFFGVVGAHKFYVGRKKAGFLHILASAFLIGLLITLYDFFMIFSGRFVDSEGKTLKAIPFLSEGETYDERVAANKALIDQTAFGKWIKKNEFTKEERQSLKDGDIGRYAAETEKRRPIDNDSEIETQEESQKRHTNGTQIDDPKN